MAWARCPERDDGFTLIELLVVVVIIGILASIAIPTFLKQREKAWEKAVVADLRKAAVAGETGFDDSLVYPNSEAQLVAAGFLRSSGVSVERVVGTGTGFCFEFGHDNLDSRTWVLRSGDGVVQEATGGVLGC